MKAVVRMDMHAVLAQLDELFARKALAQVEPFLLAQLAAARQEGDAHAVLTLLNELTGYYRSISQVAPSLQMAEAALAAVAQMGLRGSRAHGTTLINAATAYRAAGDLERAAALYQEALAILRACGETGYPLAGLLNNMSQVYQALHREAEALPYLEQALAVLQGLTGVDGEIATTHSNMALVLMACGRRADAQAHLEEALRLFEAGDGPRDAHYGAALATAAGLAYECGDYASAVQLYERALPEIRQSFGENDGYHITQRNLALAQQALAKGGQR